jgi:abequosyltransferase
MRSSSRLGRCCCNPRFAGNYDMDISHVKLSTEIPAIKLSICISTLNRASFLADTLDSIISQQPNDYEIVVSDNGSTDETAEVVFEREKQCKNLRYIRHDANNGPDRNYDRAVQLARGQYCWTMTDDDRLKPGAVSAVLSAIQQNFSLILVNTEWVASDMITVVLPDAFNVDADRIYDPDDMDKLFRDANHHLTYIGGYIFKRSIWLSRDKEQYYGSMFIHLAVAFQKPLPGRTLLIKTPLISYRRGNSHEWWADAFEIFAFRLPALVDSLGVPNAAKAEICGTKPWMSIHTLIASRAWDAYSLREYRTWVRPRLRSSREALAPWLIAILPAALLNRLYIVYLVVTRQRALLPDVINSPLHAARRRKRL